MCKTISKPTLFSLFPEKQETPTNIEISTFVGVLSFLNLTRFHLRVPVVGVEPHKVKMYIITHYFPLLHSYTLHEF